MEDKGRKFGLPVLGTFVHTQIQKYSPSFQKATEVDVTTVDSVTIESNSVANISFEIRGNTVGTLNIIGLEYSLKALFPNKEPTDHQIRGKQYFQG